MKKIILSAMVAAAAIFGGFTANQTSEMASMGLLDATDVEAEAAPGDGGGSMSWNYFGPEGSGNIKQGTSTTSSQTVSNVGQANAGVDWLGGQYSRTKTKVVQTTVTYYYCDNSTTIPCRPYVVTMVVEWPN